MGGWAYQIGGSIDPKIAEPIPVPKFFMDKILGRQRFRKPKEWDLGNDKVIDLPADRFSPIKEHFLNYLKNTLQSPWSATTYIIRYLELDVMTIHFRGEKNAGSDTTNWCFQISFSGCAGEAEASAQLVSHWFALYHKNSLQQLREQIFTPNGFYPTEYASDDSELRFLPLAEGGYAVFNNDPQEMFFKDETKSFHFEVDYAALGDQSDGGLNIMTELERKYAALMSDGKCRCQMCMPDFIESADYRG